MLELRSLHVSNLLMWKNVGLDMAPGVTVISGANRSGKTVLLKALSLALWGSVLHKRGTEASKLPSGCKVDVRFATDGDEWLVEAQPSRVGLSKGRKSLRMHGKTMALDRLRRVIGISPQLYDTSVHLTGTTAHPLTHATPSQRLEWFSAILRLDETYDRLEAAAARKVKEAEASFTQYRILKEESVGLGRASLDHAQELEKQAAKINARLARAREELAGLIEARAACERLVDLPAYDSGLRSSKRLRSILDKKEAWLAQAREEAARFEADRAARSQRNRLKGKIEELKRARIKLGDKGTADVRRMRQLGALLSAESTKLEELARKWRSEAPLRKLARELGEPVFSPGAALDVMKKADSLSSEVLRWARASKKCPVCLHETSREHLREHVWNSFVKLRDFYPNVKKATRSLQAHDCRSRTTVRSKPCDAESVRYVAQKLAARADLIEKTQARLDTMQETLAGLPRADRVGRPPSIEDINRGAKLVQKLRSQYDRAVRQEASVAARERDRGRLRELGFDKQGLKEIEDRQAKTKTLVDTLTSRHLSLVAEASAAARDADRAQALKERMLKAKQKARRRQEYGELREAFGKRGLRLQALSRFVSAFENTLNDTAPLLWDMPVSFSLTVSEKGVSILLTRNGMTSDLTTLSGSEERVWKLLCALALIRLLPAALRADTLILDEIEAHMDAKSRYMLATSFIEAVKAFVPKIVIVSPLSQGELPITADTRFEVVKKGGVSALVAK